MTARRLVLLVLVAAVPVVCLSAVAGCRTAGPCGLILTSGSWWPVALGPPVLVASMAVAAWTVRLAVTASLASRELARLHYVQAPPKLARSAAAAGVVRIACIATSSPMAFCAGLMRPTLFVSQGAVALLSEQELLAVLHHEADHARRREPLRRMARKAAADALAFLPIVRWWSERQVERSEFAADLAAERSAGRAALAGALLVMTEPASSLAAFGGHAEMRATRLLGLQVEEARPPRALWASSFVYTWLALSLAGCVFEVIVALT